MPEATDNIYELAQKYSPEFKTKAKAKRLPRNIRYFVIPVSIAIIISVIIILIAYFVIAQNLSHDDFKFVVTTVTTILLAIIPIIQSAYYQKEIDIRDQLSTCEKVFTDLLRDIKSVCKTISLLENNIETNTFFESYNQDYYPNNLLPILCEIEYKINASPFIDENIRKIMRKKVLHAIDILQITILKIYEIISEYKKGNNPQKNIILHSIEIRSSLLLHAQELSNADEKLTILCEYLDRIIPSIYAVIEKKYSQKNTEQLWKDFIVLFKEVDKSVAKLKSDLK